MATNHPQYTWEFRNTLTRQVDLIDAIWSLRITTPNDILRLRDMCSLLPQAVLPEIIDTSTAYAKGLVYPIVSTVCFDHKPITTVPPNVVIPIIPRPPAGDDLIIVCTDMGYIHLTRAQLGPALAAAPFDQPTHDLHSADGRTRIQVQTQDLWDAFVSYGNIFWFDRNKLRMLSRRTVANEQESEIDVQHIEIIHTLFGEVTPKYDECRTILTNAPDVVSYTDLRHMIHLDGNETTYALRVIARLRYINGVRALWQLRNLAAAAECVAPPTFVMREFSAAIQTIFNNDFPTDLARPMPPLPGSVEPNESLFLIEGHQPRSRAWLMEQLNTPVRTILGYPRAVIMRAFATTGYRFVGDGANLVMVRSFLGAAPTLAAPTHLPPLVPPPPPGTPTIPGTPAPPAQPIERAAVALVEQAIRTHRPIADIIPMLDTALDAVEYLTTVAFRVTQWDIDEIPLFAALATRSMAAAQRIRTWCQNNPARRVVKVLFLSRLVALLFDLNIPCPLEAPIDARSPIRHAYTVLRSQYVFTLFPDAIHKCPRTFVPTTSECFNAVDNTMCAMRDLAADTEQVYFYVAPNNIECQDKTTLARRVDASLDDPSAYIGVGVLTINVLHIVEAAITRRQIFYTRQVEPGHSDLLC